MVERQLAPSGAIKCLFNQVVQVQVAVRVLVRLGHLQLLQVAVRVRVRLGHLQHQRRSMVFV